MHAGDPLQWALDMLFGWFFWLFNHAFNAGNYVYTGIVGILLRVSVIVLLIYAGLLWATYREFQRVPTGFIPQQDKGYLLVNVQLPDAAAVERTQRVMQSDRTACAATRRSRSHREHRRTIAADQRQRTEPGLDVRHAQANFHLNRPGLFGR